MQYLSDFCQDEIVELLFLTAPCPLAAMDEKGREAFVLALYRCVERELARAVREERVRWMAASTN